MALMNVPHARNIRLEPSHGRGHPRTAATVRRLDKARQNEEATNFEAAFVGRLASNECELCMPVDRAERTLQQRAVL